MERDSEDGLVELLAVRGDLLNASLGLQIPQANAAVVTWREKKDEDIASAN